MHGSPTIAQSWLVHTPPKQPSEQQSWAAAQGTPFARHASLHSMTPAWPVTGSQRPLQHWGLIVQLALGARQVPPGPPESPAKVPPTHTPPVHVPEQQSKPLAQAAIAGAHAVGPPSALPPHTFDVHAPTQQSAAVVHPAPTLRQVVPASPSTGEEPSSPSGGAPSIPPSAATTDASVPQWRETAAAHAIDVARDVARKVRARAQ
jgi:hypothetical protein